MLKNKPACCFVGVCAGIAIVPLTGSIIPTICLAIIILTALFIKKRFFVVVLLFALAGVLAMTVSQPIYMDQNSENATLTGYVADEVKDGVYNIRNAQATENGNAYNYNKMVRLYTEKPLHSGDEIKFNGKIKAYSGATNFGGTNWKNVMLAKDTSHSMFSKEGEVTGKRINVYSCFGMLKEYLTSDIDKNLGKNSSGLVKAILLGDKTDVPEEVLADFRTSGISHILAISGLHIGIIVAAFCFLLRNFKAKTQIISISIFLLCFLFLTCFNSSVFRAGIMAVIWLTAKIKGYRYNLMTSLFTAGMLILLFNPYNIYAAGFLLSFTCVLGIGLFYRWFYNRLSWFISPIRTSLSMYFACQLGMMPVAIYFFNQFQLYSFLANIFAVPLVSFVLITALVGVIVLPLGLAYLPLVFSYSIMKIISYIAKITATVPFSVITIPTPPLILLLAFYAVLIFTVIWYYNQRKAAIIAGGFMLGTMILVNFHNLDSTPQITMLDVGDGLCLHIRTQNNKHIIVDGGRDFKPENDVIKYLRSIGANDLILIGTHDDLDHYGGFIEMPDEFRIEAYLSPVLKGDKQYNDFILSMGNKDIKVVQFMAGSSMEFDGAVLQSIAPSYLTEDSNENSMQAYVTINGKTLLITGDTPIEKEESYNKVDILQVAHHGSDTSTSPEMLTKARPEISLVSGDKYMDSSVTSRLGHYYDTKNSGAVRLFLKDTINIKTMKGTP